MARADLLKKLFSSFKNEDRDLFIETAYQIISDERKKKHIILADELENILKETKLYYNKTIPTIKTSEHQDGQLVEISYQDKYFEDIIILEEKKLQLIEIIREFKNWDILISNGVAPISRILFYGPPGCGKTLCAKVLATELGIPLMYVRFDAIISSYLGETANNIRKVFDLAKNDKFIILFDEFDAIGRSRTDPAEHGEIKRVVNTFLQQIDNYKGRSIIIAATNFESSLDYAIWRRFDDTIRFNLPTNEEKIKLFNLKLKCFEGPNYVFETFFRCYRIIFTFRYRKYM